MSASRTAITRRAVFRLERLLLEANDNETRGRLRQKLAGARLRLDTLLRNHDRRLAKAEEQGIEGGEWWRQINRPRA
jgi:hypothetical protein